MPLSNKYDPIFGLTYKIDIEMLMIRLVVSSFPMRIYTHTYIVQTMLRSTPRSIRYKGVLSARVLVFRCLYFNESSGINSFKDMY